MEVPCKAATRLMPVLAGSILRCPVSFIDLVFGAELSNKLMEFSDFSTQFALFDALIKSKPDCVVTAVVAVNAVVSLFTKSLLDKVFHQLS